MSPLRLYRVTYFCPDFTRRTYCASVLSKLRTYQYSCLLQSTLPLSHTAHHTSQAIAPTLFSLILATTNEIHRFFSTLQWQRCILGCPTCFYREISFLPLEFDSPSPSSISTFSPQRPLFYKSTTRFFPLFLCHKRRVSRRLSSCLFSF